MEIEGYSDYEASSDEAEDEEYPQDKSVWAFKMPTLMFQAKTYTDMIDWVGYYYNPTFNFKQNRSI